MATPTTLHHLALAERSFATDLAYDARSALGPYVRHLLAARDAGRRKIALAQASWADAEQGFLVDLEAVDPPFEPPVDPPREATQLAGEPWDGRLRCRLPARPTEPILVADNGVHFRWKKAPAKNRGHRVALLEGRIGADETVDPRTFFFGDGVREVVVLDGGGRRKGRLKILGRSSSDFALVLEARPPEGSRLGLPVNLTALNRQLQALYTLRDAPHPDHHHLVRLLLQPHRAGWPRVQPQEVDRWYLLDDPSIEGTEDQRAFVGIALGTPDLALLEGPPGSGKTHAICELVLQLVAEGKRVLLCSNTHVAVDNVLERLSGRFPDIVPVRLGREERVDPLVRNCQLDRQVEKLEGVEGLPGQAAARLVLASANLVCGTTSGFLSHPAFAGGVSEPVFDVLIIDEASKTTFQEFVVPALWARRQVIVGDVRQLPPFSSMEDLEASLTNLSTRDRRLGAAGQRALYLLHELGQSWARPWRWLLVEDGPVVEALLKELSAREAREPVVASAKDTPLERLAADVVVLRRGGEEDLLESLPPDLLPFGPAGHPVLDARREHWLEEQPDLCRSRRIRRDRCRHVREVVAAARPTRSWASELAWRLAREHALQAARGDKGHRVAGGVRALLPVAEDGDWVEDAVRALQEVGLRSAIEALRDGRRTLGRRSALTEALPAPAWGQRSVILSWQHRMHPELSAFPRETFYDGQALRDASTVHGRAWDFLPDLPARRTWVDVRGNVQRGVNQAEVDAIRSVLALWDREQEADLAVLALHVAQERALRKALRTLCDQPRKQSRFQLGGARIQLATVDRFQGREADLVFLSLRNTGSTGHADCPGRLNVALTRARHQLLVVGDHRCFSRCRSPELVDLTCQTPVVGSSWFARKVR